jgi:hypothetical protein
VGGPEQPERRAKQAEPDDGPGSDHPLNPLPGHEINRIDRIGSEVRRQKPEGVSWIPSRSLLCSRDWY